MAQAGDQRVFDVSEVEGIKSGILFMYGSEPGPDGLFNYLGTVLSFKQYRSVLCHPKSLTPYLPASGRLWRRKPRRSRLYHKASKHETP